MASVTQEIIKTRLTEVSQALVTVTSITKHATSSVAVSTSVLDSLKSATTETISPSVAHEIALYSNLLSANTENVSHGVADEIVLLSALGTITTENVSHSVTSAYILYGDVTSIPTSIKNYYDVLRQLMPFGINELLDSSNFKGSLKLDGRQLQQVDNRIEQLLLEIMPDTAVELLNQWERITRNVVGLSTTDTDIIYKALELGKIEERQKQVVARLTAEGSIGEDMYTGLATAFGYNADVTEYLPTMVNKAVCGDRLLEEHSQWVWRLRIHDTIAKDKQLESLVSEMKPAHTRVFFTYPMADKIAGTWHLVDTLSTVEPNFFIQYAGYVYTNNNTQLRRSADGKTWENFSVAFTNVPTCAAVFDGALYVGTQTDYKIWKIVDNIVDATAGDGKNYFKNVFTASANPSAMEIFNDKLYLATLNLNDHYRTNDGKTWETITSVRTGNITSLRIFDGKLYAGTDTVGIIYKSTTGLSWSISYDSPAINIQTLEVYEDYLYAGSEDYSSIWRTLDGDTWSEINIAYNAEHLLWFDEQIYAACSGGVLLRSSSGTVWNVVETLAAGLPLHLLGTIGSKILRIKYDNPNYKIELSTIDASDTK